MVGEAADSLHQGGIGFVRARPRFYETKPIGNGDGFVCAKPSRYHRRLFYETKPIESRCVGFVRANTAGSYSVVGDPGRQSLLRGCPGWICETKPNPGAGMKASAFPTKSRLTGAESKTDGHSPF